MQKWCLLLCFVSFCLVLINLKLIIVTSKFSFSTSFTFYLSKTHDFTFIYVLETDSVCQKHIYVPILKHRLISPSLKLNSGILSCLDGVSRYSILFQEERMSMFRLDSSFNNKLAPQASSFLPIPYTSFGVQCFRFSLPKILDFAL